MSVYFILLLKCEHIIMKIERPYLKSKVKKGLDPDLAPRIRARQQTPNGRISYQYYTAVFDITTGKKHNKGYSFGEFRPRKEAYRLLMKWRRDTVKEINREAKKLGLI